MSTKGEWYFEDSADYFEICSDIVVNDHHLYGHVATVEKSEGSKENAERIVVAVNHHDKLVASHESAIELLKEREGWDEAISAKLREMREVLSSVKRGAKCV